MWVAIQRKVPKIFERFSAPLLADRLLSNITPQHLGNFDV
jgi:hypothetical protein